MFPRTVASRKKAVGPPKVVTAPSPSDSVENSPSHTLADEKSDGTVEVPVPENAGSNSTKSRVRSRSSASEAKSKRPEEPEDAVEEAEEGSEDEEGDKAPDSKRPRKAGAAKKAVKKAKGGEEKGGERKVRDGSTEDNMPASGEHQVNRVIYSASMRKPTPVAVEGEGVSKKRPLTILSWNVAGLRALLTKEPSAMPLLAEKEPFLDAICLQEVKLQPSHIKNAWEKMGLKEKGFEHVYWSLSEEKLGYSGVAIACRRRPVHVSYGLGHVKHDGEGRVITLEFPEYYLINTYVPNAGDGLKRLDYRTTEWDVALADHIIALRTVGRRIDASGHTTSSLEVEGLPGEKEGEGLVAVAGGVKTMAAIEGRGSKRGAGEKGGGKGGRQTQIKSWFVSRSKKGEEGRQGEEGRSVEGEKSTATTDETVPDETTKSEALKSAIPETTNTTTPNPPPANPVDPRLGQPKPVILTGDLNCAREAIDIHNPKGNLRTAGFTFEERQSFKEHLLGRCQLHDSFREMHPEVVGYSYYGYRFNARAKGHGWRLDYVMLSDALGDDVYDAFVVPEVHGSDHVPVGVTLMV